MTGRSEWENQPLVSVVMIFLNAGKFIEEAIESVFAQSYDTWELLLVDDGSTDVSTDVAQRYAEQHPERVHYLDHKGHQNRGMRSASRNLGISQAKGEYIGFLDADDVWLPHKLAKQVFVLYSHPEVGMVMAGTEWWYSWTGSTEDASLDRVAVPAAPLEKTVEPATLLEPFLQGRLHVPVHSVLVQRESVARVGGFNDSFSGIYEDQVFFAKIFLNERVYALQDCVCRYRQHPESAVATSVRTFERPFGAEEKFLNWLEGYLTANGSVTADVQPTLRRRLWPYRHPVAYRFQRAVRSLQDHLDDIPDALHERVGNLQRLVLGRPTGTLLAIPNPVPVVGRRWNPVVTELRWIARGTSDVEVHVGAPDGPLFSRSGPCGSARTGKWVVDGTVFYLQDASDGRSPSPANSLARVKIRISTPPEPS